MVAVLYRSLADLYWQKCPIYWISSHAKCYHNTGTQCIQSVWPCCEPMLGGNVPNLLYMICVWQFFCSQFSLSIYSYAILYLYFLVWAYVWSLTDYRGECIGWDGQRVSGDWSTWWNVAVEWRCMTVWWCDRELVIWWWCRSQVEM